MKVRVRVRVKVKVRVMVRSNIPPRSALIDDVSRPLPIEDLLHDLV